MDKFARKVYAFLLNSPNQICSVTQLSTLDAQEIDIIRAIDYLRKNEYVVPVPDQNSFMLTHEGIHKRELERLAFRKLFFSRYLPGFISGIVSGAAISLLTCYILSLFG